MFQKIFDFFVLTVNEDGYLSYYPTTAGNMALVLLAIILFIAMAAFAGYKIKTRVKQLAFSAMAITLAVVTSMLPLFSLPYGGSVTLLSMFFICLIGYLYGTKAGILTGIAFGLINLVLKPYVVHPVQLFMDYPIAFGCLGLAGSFCNSKYGLIKGYLLGVVGRFVCSALSGYIFFASYTPEGMSTIAYTIVYNGSYMGIEAAITVALLLLPVVADALKEVKILAVQD